LVSLALVLAAVLGGCGGGGDEGTAGLAQEQDPPRGQQAQPDRELLGRAVIQGWSEALLGGDVEKATSFFALPVTVSNGTPPVTLRTRAQVQLFNRTLPCGARLTGVRRRGRYLEASFRLTERPGGQCGQGVGGAARTAFLIRGGRIAEWRRVPEAGSAPPAAGPEV